MSTYPALGKYQILEEIGRGGMGAVYKAHDPFLDRVVAVKILAPHLVWERAFLERFLREARATARLQHSNIVPIYDVGQDGSNYYFVMAYLPGLSLKQYIAEKGRFAPAEAIPILRQLADALDYAHSKGLVHRDVKPGNVMFDEQGRPMLTDFGIVKAAEESRLTATGASLGTPEYMAPEQITGRPVDARTDEYALGVIAFEMLTGRAPFAADTTTAVLYMHVHEPLPSATACCPDLPLAVEGALNRALAKSPDERYASCGEFIAALAQAAGEPAAPGERYAAPPAPPEARRRPPAAVTPPPPVTPPRPAKPARRRGLSRLPLVIAFILLIGAVLAGAALILWPRLASPPPLSTPPTAPALTPPPAPPLPPVISPQNGERIEVVRHTEVEQAHDIAYSPDGNLLAVLGKAGVVLCNAETLEAVHTIPTEQYVWNIAISPDGSALAGAMDNGDVRMWGIPNGELLRTLGGHTNRAVNVAFSGDGRFLASSSCDSTLRIWTFPHGDLWETLRGEPACMWGIAFSPDGETLARATSRDVKLYNAPGGRELRSFPSPAGVIIDLAFSPDGTWLAAAAPDMTVLLWPTRPETPSRALKGHTNRLNGVAFSPDGAILASAAQDETVRLWQTSDGGLLTIAQGHSGGAVGVAFSPDGTTLATAAADGVVRLWRVRLEQ